MAQAGWDLSVPLNRKRKRSLTHPQGLNSTAGPNRGRDSKGWVKVGRSKLAGNSTAALRWLPISVLGTDHVILHTRIVEALRCLEWVDLMPGALRLCALR